MVATAALAPAIRRLADIKTSRETISKEVFIVIERLKCLQRKTGHEKQKTENQSNAERKFKRPELWTCTPTKTASRNTSPKGYSSIPIGSRNFFLIKTFSQIDCTPTASKSLIQKRSTHPAMELLATLMLALIAGSSIAAYKLTPKKSAD